HGAVQYKPCSIDPGEERGTWENSHLDSGTLLGYTKCRGLQWRLISTSSIFVRCNWPSHWDIALISLSSTRTPTSVKSPPRVSISVRWPSTPVAYALAP